jgi:ADP-ribose pyrophosphatase
MPKDQSADLSISSRELIHNGMVWDVVREQFDYRGVTLTREFVAHPGAVAVVALNEKNEVLLIKQYRHPVRSFLWELPAGLLDQPGEALVAAAQRELLEETGYVAEQWSELIEFHTTPGGNSETISIFLARNLVFAGHNFELHGEEVDLEVAWFALDEVLDSILKSEMRNPAVSVGIMAASLKLNRNA